VDSYRKGIRDAAPVSKVITDRVSISTLAICAESRKKAQERGAEILDWYRRQQDLRHDRVWQAHDPTSVPTDYQWHYQRSAATETAKRDETSSLDLIKEGRYCIGDPDDCLRFLERYVPTGVDEIMPLFQIGPMANEEVTETLRLFGKHVIPHLEKTDRAEAGTP
jgi:alkanesulfonate monooxygenase SsuD/methylene tetrahydromethanopterin reductase-like flavin-dependent oxidoreductase (luciferase family)